MLLFFYTLSRKRKYIYKFIFCVVAVIEITVTAFMGFNENGQISNADLQRAKQELLHKQKFNVQETNATKAANFKSAIPKGASQP